MIRLIRTAAAFTFGFALIVAPLGNAYAEEEAGDEDEEMQEMSSADTEPTVAGVIYHVDEQRDGSQTLRIYNKELDLEVKILVSAPPLVKLVKDKVACVGRFVTASGERIDDVTLVAQGLQVDMSKACGTPPK